MKDNNGNTLKFRVEQLEKNYDSLDSKVDKVLQNHLPHILEEISKCRFEIEKGEARIMAAVEQNKLKLGIIIGVAVIIANALLKELMNFI